MTSTYFNMTEPSGSSGFLPTVTFDCSNTGINAGIFNSSHLTTQLAAIGITGFYEADFTNNVTTIDVGAFQNDTKVVVVTINKVTSIGASAFSGCTSLRSITLDTAVDATYKRYLLTSIGNSAFSGCTSLRNLYIPDTVKSIPNALCQDCTGLEVAVMGYGCASRDANDNYIADASIGENAFSGCTKLSYFIIPETVGTVGNNAFNGCIALSYVAIYGKPTFGTNVFQGAKALGATYVYDNVYTTSILINNVTIAGPSFLTGFTSLPTTKPYTEFLFDASGSTSLDSTYVSQRFNGISTNTLVKVKIKGGITTIASDAFRPGGGIGAKYSNILAVSFPSTLTTISSQAFETSGTTDYACNVGGFYLPNSITTVGASAFNVKLTVFNTTLTKQIVSTSGTSTITTVGTPFPFASTIKALIIANCSTISAQYCDTAKNLQLVNFFQKNAYSTFTAFANASFQYTFIAGNVGSGTHYIYIPKQVTGSNMTNIFNGPTATMLFTVYDKTADGIAGDNTDGLGTNSNNSASYLTTANLGIAADKATIHLICNWYTASGTLQGAMKDYGYKYHVLFHPNITTITNRFYNTTNISSVTLPSRLVNIPQSSFQSCTFLKNVFIPTTSNLTTIGSSAFQGCTALTSFFIPNSLHRISQEMFNGCTSLASITYGDNPGIISIDQSAFYNTTRALTSIFIPASVVNIGRFAFNANGGSASRNILNTVTIGAGSRLKAIGGFAFGNGGGDIYNSAAYLHNLVLPSTLRYMGGNTADNGRIFQNAFISNHTDNFIFPSSVTFLPYACFYADTTTTDISNVYVPMSITTIAGPRIHNGYRDNTNNRVAGIGGYIFSTSRAGSLIYLPSHLSGVDSPADEASATNKVLFPDANRTRSYYKSASYSANTLTSLELQGGVANTSNQATTTQIHADILTSVFVIGDGANSITTADSGNAANLISVNIPSSVTTIRDHAFKGSSALVYVTFSENSHLTSIGASSFQDCSMIHDIRLPDTLTSIGQNAFSGCRNLTSISIPYNVTSLGSGAFYTNPNSTFTSLGSTLTGPSIGSYFGSSVSLSSDGSTLAVGASSYSISQGLVQVYKFNGSTWTIVGNGTFYGTASSRFGTSVSLSSDGTTVAVGANGYNINQGFVQVYKFNGATSTWTIVGNGTFYGTASSQVGSSVSLSSDGTTVAVGAPSYSNNQGLVQVYKFNGTTWNIVGNGTDLSGTAAAVSSFGGSVSLSSDGSTVAVGAPFYSNNDYQGFVQVYKFNGTTWNIVGNGTLYGPGPLTSQFGRSVSLSSDGTTVAVGAPSYSNNQGLVQVYKFNGTTWNIVGTQFSGTAGSSFGWSVSLSSDGTTVAVGAYLYDNNRGLVQVYKFNESTSTWTIVGNSTDLSVQTSSRFGTSVSLSSNGRTVAGGGPHSFNGFVQVFNRTELKSVQMHQRLYTDISSSLSSYFTSPSSISFQIIPALLLTNTLNPSKLTISQINNLYIRQRQSQLGFCTKITVAASNGDGILRASDITTALAGTTGFVHLDISTNVTSIASGACLNNTQIYSVAISKTVVTISTNSFFGCTNLSYLSFHPDSVCTTIGNNAFNNNNIIDLTLPDSLTTIGSNAFQPSNTLTSVCIPKSVTLLGLGVGPFLGCPKLTSVVLPSDLSSLGTGTYFSTTGTTPISFTSYSMTSDIPHFKLSDFSLPSGIVQNVLDSAVTYIDHRAYAYYPDITLYAVNSTYQQTITSGPASYQVNNIKMPIMPATFMMNGASWQNFNLFPIYRSVPDLNVYSDVSGTVTAGMDNLDDGFLLMPGYSLCVFTNLYDEENISVFDVALANIEQPYTTAVEKSTYIDNQFGKVPINVSGSTYFGFNNATSSVLIMFNGKILGKMFVS